MYFVNSDRPIVTVIWINLRHCCLNISHRSFLTYLVEQSTVQRSAWQYFQLVYFTKCVGTLLRATIHYFKKTELNSGNKYVNATINSEVGVSITVGGVRR